MEDKYYVYKVYVRGEVIYVGKGLGSRSKHVLSGKSHNVKLNEYYFRHKLLGDECPVVKKVKFFEDEAEALSYETYLIKDLLPDCNVRGTKEKVKKKPRGKVGRPKKVKKKVPPKKPKTVKVQKPKPDVQEDIVITLPDNYEDFYEYISSLYETYIKQSVSENPHSLKWFCYSKREGKMWKDYVPYLDRIFEELDKEDKKNPTKTGRKAGFPSMFNFSDGERSAFYRLQRELGIRLDPNKEEDYEYAEKWINDYRNRKSSPN